MSPGDVIESAIWIDGTESAEQRQAHEELVRANVAEICRDNGLSHGPVVFVEKHPYDERVPPVPDHIDKQAPDPTQIRLLVAEATVLGYEVQQSDSIAANLESRDRGRLRDITRKVHRQRYPQEARLTDEECDAMIDEIGPDAAVEALRRNTTISQYH